MKFNISIILFLSLLFLCPSCGNKVKEGDSITLSPEEENSIEFIKDKIGKEYPIVSTKVYTGDFPYILSEDYSTAFNLFLMGHMFRSKLTNEDISSFISTLGAIAEVNKSKYNNKEPYVTVMAEVKTNKDTINPIEKFICVFKQPFDYENEEEPTKIGRVTKETKSLAVMIIVGQSGLPYDTLCNMDESEALKLLEKHISDPVIKFIIEP